MDLEEASVVQHSSFFISTKPECLRALHILSQIKLEVWRRVLTLIIKSMFSAKRTNGESCQPPVLIISLQQHQHVSMGQCAEKQFLGTFLK